MGGSENLLGLLFTIDADPAKAQAAMEEFALKTGQALGLVEAQVRDYGVAQRAAYDEAVQRARGLDEAVLNSRQSVQLLAAEFGIHLPRAVTSAIAEIVPSIAGMGTALLAVFAVKEVIQFTGYVRKCADEFNGVTAAAKEYKQVGEENLSLMEAAAKASMKYARSQAALLIAQAEAGRANVQHLKDEESGLNAMNPIIAQSVQAYRFWFGASKDLAKAEADLLNIESTRDAIVKILGEDETKAHKDAAKAASEHLKELEKHQARARELQNQFNQELIRERSQWEKHWDEMVKMEDDAFKKMLAHPLKMQLPGFDASLFSPLIAAQNQLTNAERQSLPTLRELQTIRQNLAKLFPQMTREEIDLKAQELARNSTVVNLIGNTARLTGSSRALRQEYQQLIEKIYELTSGKKMYLSVSEQWTRALDAEAQAMRQNTLAAIEGISAGVAGLIGGRRAQAAVEGAFDAAKAIEMWARFAASWGTDVGAGLAAAKYTLAAAEMFKVAGTGESSAGGGGGAYAGASAGGGSASASGSIAAGGSPSAPTSGAASARSGPSRSITINFQGPIYGGKAGLNEMIRAISQAVRDGTGPTMVSNYSIQPSRIRG